MSGRQREVGCHVGGGWVLEKMALRMDDLTEATFDLWRAKREQFNAAQHERMRQAMRELYNDAVK